MPEKESKFTPEDFDRNAENEVERKALVRIKGIGENLSSETLLEAVKNYPNKFKALIRNIEWEDSRHYQPIIALILELSSDRQSLEDFKKALESCEERIDINFVEEFVKKTRSKPLEGVRMLEIGGGPAGLLRYERSWSK